MFVGLLIGLIWEHFNQQELAAAAGRKGDGRSAYKVHTEEAENLVMEEKMRTIANNNGKLFIERAASRTVCLRNDRKRRVG
ncbi:hypothetical protein Goklo_010544 [Gossypium klotzschianum]|uniref:Uncharacterized protein n=1 Tax=Gossypium klotzschianum TaxID=34286 RepID=A0A7J8V6C0_9ROSI|nr:hypothetical protein [Gossypium klotzschianum]